MKSIYVKSPNEVFARHSLATRKQAPSESIDEYLQILKLLSKDCNFKAVTASQHSDEAIRDAFINGILSSHIRQRLLENKILSLQDAFEQARALDTAQKSSDSYDMLSQRPMTASLSRKMEELNQFHFDEEEKECGAVNVKCFFCAIMRMLEVAALHVKPLATNVANVGIFKRFASLTQCTRK